MAEIVGNIIYNNQKGNRVYKDYELIYYVGQLYKSKDVSEITVLTQAEYDNLVVKDPNIIYVIVQEGSTIEELAARIQELPNQVNSVTSLEIKRNGTYTAPTGVLGYNNISVNVEGGGGVNNLFVVQDSDCFGRSRWTVVPNYYDLSLFKYRTNFNFLFKECINLVSIPEIDTSSGTSFYYMFDSCHSLSTIPKLNTSNGTDFSGMFSDCMALDTIPQIDTAKGTDFSNMVSFCTSLDYMPLIDTSKGTNFDRMFYYCTNLTSIPEIDTSSGTNFSDMFGSCPSLRTISKLNLSNGSSFGSIFYNCTQLTNITLEGSINENIDFSPCKKLTYESVRSILIACSNKTNTNSKTLKFNLTHTDKNGQLATLVADCNRKGWTVSGLTLN